MRGIHLRLRTVALAGLCAVVTIASARAMDPPRPAPASDASPGVPVSPTVDWDVKHDVSRPLWDIVAGLPPRAPSTEQRTIALHFPSPPAPLSTAGAAQDPVLQDSAGLSIGALPGLNFDGIGADGVAPPDTNGSAGATQFVEIVNTEYAVFDKTSGAPLLSPTTISAIWSGFGGLCETSNGGDPIVIYDKAAGRWMVSQLAYSSGFGSNFQCIAVSTTSDARGSYARYAFDFGGNLPDYPKFGVWTDAYYWSTNTFPGGGAFIGAQACAFDRSAMLAGRSASKVCFQQGSSVASLLPADADGSTPPPAGEPNFFIEMSGGSSLALFRFHVDFSNPANSSFTGPFTIPVAAYAQACGGGTCVPQLGTTQTLDSLGDRLMYRLAYRNFGDHESLVVNHSVDAGGRTGVRWYEIRNPNTTPTVFQQGTFAPDSNSRWMGSVAMDRFGDIGLGYTVSGPTMNPAIRYTGRVPGDPLGTLEAEASIVEGAGSQVGLSRWGDYSVLSVDPADDCTFWHTNLYIPYNGNFNWQTRVASFSFPGCAGDFTIAAAPPSRSVARGQSTTYTVTVTAQNGFNGLVTFGTTGLPRNATSTFNPPSVTGSGTSILTITTKSTTPQGPATVKIYGVNTKTFYHTTQVQLVVN